MKLPRTIQPKRERAHTGLLPPKKTVRRLFSCTSPVDGRTGFSLVEITLVMGIVCFALLPILGLLPIGLSTISAATTQTSEANIAKEMNAELQRISLSEITDLSQMIYYYDKSGSPVTNAKDAFFSANFSINNPCLPGVPLDFDTIAKTVVVTLRYPHNIPTAAQKTFVFSLLAAQQSGN